MKNLTKKEKMKIADEFLYGCTGVCYWNDLLEELRLADCNSKEGIEEVCKRKLIADGYPEMLLKF